MGWGSSLLKVRVILIKASKNVLQQLSSELRLLVLHSFENALSSTGRVYFFINNFRRYFKPIKLCGGDL